MIEYLGDISRNDALVLQELAEKADNILEFGCGASTQVLSYYSRNKILSIDTSTEWIEKTKFNFSYLEIENIPEFKLYNEFSFSSGEYDLIFDDGADGLRREFAINVWPLLKIGGCITFHDTRRWHDQANICAVIIQYYNEIEYVQCNYKSSNITVIKKKIAEHYDNWAITENKAPWQSGNGVPPIKLPFISAKCITYGRVDFLEEQLQSFLQQDYPKDLCELVIVNDYPLQKLIFEHPQVRIFNLDKTFDTIGAKENFATEQCKGDIIAQYDDDDIALPNHLSNIAKYFIPGSDLLHWNRAVYMDVPKIKDIIGVGNSGIIYSRKIWKQLGGYPLENAGHDMSFVVKIKSISPNIVLAYPPDDEVSWIYCWGGRGYHLSGAGTDTPDRPNVIQRHSSYIESERKKGNVPTGDIILKPHWNHDYCQILKDFINEHK